MKKTNFLITCTLLLFLGVFSSCEDKNEDVFDEMLEDEVNDNDETGNNTTGTDLCIGNGTEDPLPLAIGNRWYFQKTRYGSENIEIKINETVIENNQEYFKVKFRYIPGGSFTRLYRKAPNGDVYELEKYNDGTSKEYMIVPMTPINNQEWEYHGFNPSLNYKRKIRLVEANFPINTDDCTYSKYIIVDEVIERGSGNYEIIINDMFARGIGFLFGRESVLTELTLN